MQPRLLLEETLVFDMGLKLGMTQLEPLRVCDISTNISAPPLVMIFLVSLTIMIPFKNSRTARCQWMALLFQLVQQVF